ncbi:MAG TPA: hypothetical protein VLU46_16975 [Thermoanaerobaculia bacterium]|nr:hypothetical protein [Thermoanaerobaculia bacterium]
MRLVPAPEEQKWLTRNLRKLIAKNGYEHFACAPIVEPTRRFFPEGWNGTVGDVHVVTQRLLHMAGLGDLRVHMTMYGESEYGHAAGWFRGIEDDRCIFGVEITQMHDPEAAAGVMAHEVAHAWRHRQGVCAPSNDKEELLTDLTTVYLGFGILTANNTDRYRSSGNYSETRWSTTTVGYLPPDAMSFVLALQASARNRRDEMRTIEKHLEPNQKACFAEAMRVLLDVDVLQELALPARETWAARSELERIEVDAPDEDEVAAPEPVVPARRNQNRIASAVPQGSKGLMAGFGLVQGILGGLLVCGMLQTTDGLAALSLVAIAAVVGGIVGSWRSKIAVCSACRAPLGLQRDECRKCGATIAGAGTLEEHDDDDCPDCAPEFPCAAHAQAVFIRPASE